MGYIMFIDKENYNESEKKNQVEFIKILELN